MAQHILVIASFVLSVFLLFNMFRKNFSGKSSCGGGCSGCSAVDFKKIEAAMKADGK